MDIIYKYDVSLTINNYLLRVKNDFSIIFKETIEKYVFLRLSADELLELLKLRYFNSTDEYFFVEGIKLWLKYDLKHRLDNAQSLFSLINCGSCNKAIMLQYKQIDTGNCKLNKIIEQIHFKISILNNNTALGLFKFYEVKSIESFNIPPIIPVQLNTVFNSNGDYDDETYFDDNLYYNECDDYNDCYDDYDNSYSVEMDDYEYWD